MANLTLSIDDDLVHRARPAALKENTSVNALVREYLGTDVDARSSRSSPPWSRESLHEP